MLLRPVSICRLGTRSMATRKLARSFYSVLRSKHQNKEENESPSSSEEGEGKHASTSRGITTESHDVDEYLGTVWKDVKSDLGKTLGPEEAKVLETINYDDLVGSSDKLMRKLANEQMGPLLDQMGVSEEPFSFFIDLLKIATFMQLVTCATIFYATEIWGHYDTGEAFRAVSGLTFGYVLRPFFRIEQLLWPVYNWATQLIEPNSEYRVAASTHEEVQATLNRLGILAALAFLLPQGILHWDVGESTQLVAPMAIGLLLFDMVYMVALLFKLKML